MTADLNDLQANITPLLRAQLNRSDHCGERLSVESASLVPGSPDANLTVNVHYERWRCAKVFGKEVAKRLVGGNGMVVTRLTPSVGESGIALNATVEKTDADGSLGEVLRAESLGASIQEKIAHSIESAIHSAANFNSLLPPAVASVSRIRGIHFAEEQAGRLWLNLRAEAIITPEEFQGLASQHRSERRQATRPHGSPRRGSQGRDQVVQLLVNHSAKLDQHDFGGRDTGNCDMLGHTWIPLIMLRVWSVQVCSPPSPTPKPRP